MSRITLTQKLMSIPVGLSLLAMATTVSAQVAQPMVGIQLLSSGLTSPLSPSSTNATIARLVLDTTGSSEAVRISSLPFILNTGNGANPATLTNCRVVNETNTANNLSLPLGTGVGLVSGVNNIAFASPQILSAGTVTTLDLVCDPSAGLVNGGTFSVSMNTTNLSATGASTGLPALVTIRGSAPVVPVIPPTFPTVPNTGAGGNATMNWTIILGSLALVAVGIAYTRKTAKTTQAR